MSLTKMKAETESRMTEEKKTADRKRNLIILIEKYLLTLGCLDTVTKLEQETNITMEKWDTADNIDLYMIFLDYEHYYEMRFGKPPKVVKKTEDSMTYQQLKRAALKQKQINSTINKPLEQGQQQPPLPNKPNFKKKDSSSQKGQKSTQGINSDKNIEIQGSNFTGSKKKEDDEDLFDVRVLKGIPDYSDVPQYKELAAYLQRDILVENPNVKFEDIIGLENAKRLIKEAVLMPLKYPYYFEGIRQAWKGVLLYGPPGTGKTMLAKSVATQCKTTFFNISASSVVSKWRGDSEKLIRLLFQLARFYQPSTIFIDEIDSIMSQRSSSGSEHEGSRRMKTQLLIQMDGVMKKKDSVFILAASNIPWDLDPAMLRRLEKRILVDLPCLEAREDMVKKLLPPGYANELDYSAVAQRLQGYSGSDIRIVCKEAAMKPLRKLLTKLEDIEVNEPSNSNKYKNKSKEEIVQPEPVTMKDLMEAVESTKKSPGLSTERYTKWDKQHGAD